MSYQKRRYRVENGQLLKSWDGDKIGWFVTKAEAWAAFEKEIGGVEEKAVEPAQEPKPVKPVKRRRGRPRKGLTQNGNQ